VSRAFVQNHLPAILWASAIFVFSSIPSESIPNISIFSHDKLLHATVFFVLAFLLHRSLSRQKRFPGLSRHAKLWTLVGASLYGVSDEIHQLYVTGRSGDFRDAIADAAGAVLLVLILWYLERRKAARA
jgi:VanZ family protein